MRGGGVRCAHSASHVLSRLLVALFILFTPLSAFAVNPDEVLADPVLEVRARTLSAELRCMVCQNQSIDDSNAELAKDLRLLVRERIKDGDSDEEVLNYIVSRYGEFVLLKPRFSMKTVLLWGAPALLVLAGGLSLLVFARKRAGKPTGSKLTAEEQARLNELLKKQQPVEPG
ncbi:UNVERIFIED_ORG: cytochrome c-type biogenesis protein CcmH [Rhizobium esperanzae]|nr:cytochrome c-type biogenesis protein CcmH [Rhizobium esperanzae]